MRFLVAVFSIALIMCLVSMSFALDTKRVAAPAAELNLMEISLGGLNAKDECWIWMDQLDEWVWCVSAYWWDSCCALGKYVDPSEGYTDCQPPYFPFHIESMKIGMHTSWAPDTVDVIFDVGIQEQGDWDASIGCYRPGPKIWASEPLFISLSPGWYGYVDITFPGVRVDEPFFISWHILNHPNDPDGGFGWLEDYDGAVTPCWNWAYAECVGDPQWYEWFHEIADNWGDLIFRVDGRPEWNVAVSMGSLEAVAGDEMVTLNWQSMSETNNASWTVLRDGESIATLEGQGNKETATDYVYVDKGLTNAQTYSYTIEARNYEGNVDEYGPITATPLASGAVPGDFALSQNYPNPFNASTVIRYQLAADEHVTLKVYNVQGQEVASLVDTDQKAGTYAVTWKGDGVSSGMYFYTMTAGDFHQIKKMVFTK